MPNLIPRAWPGATLALACLALVSCTFLLTSVARAAMPPERAALVIGNSRYEMLGTLTNAATDARAMAATLEDLGYAVRLVTDADEITMRREIRSFASSSATAALALVYYAGHGAQVGELLLPHPPAMRRTIRRSFPVRMHSSDY